MAKLIKDISKTQRKVNEELIEEALGAKKTGIKIDTQKTPISLLGLRQFLIDRLGSSGGRPRLEGTSNKRNKIPLLDDDWDKLKLIAEHYKRKDGINVSPGQVASAIMHSLISKINIAEDELSIDYNGPVKPDNELSSSF
jgi:hypothetical protein